MLYGKKKNGVNSSTHPEMLVANKNKTHCVLKYKKYISHRKRMRGSLGSEF